MASGRKRSRSSVSSNKPARRRYLLCLDGKGYPASLEPRKIYRAVTDVKAERRGFVRIVDESGEDYLLSPAPIPSDRSSPRREEALLIHSRS
jgi:hypothetical protein